MLDIKTPYGIYYSGQQSFLNKSEALIHATKHGHDIRWDFHNNVYGRINWQRRPTTPIEELYRLRAQQIRDQYDYVVVHFSGGADSWTVLNSFISNGIHVDEIYTRWALDEQKYKTPNALDRREYNIFSEYHYAVVPVLEHVKKTCPKTYIHVDDYSDAYQSDLDEDLFTQVGGHYLCMGTFHRFSRKSPREKQAVRQGQRVAVVYGFDKIQCRAQDGRFLAYFTDRFGGSDTDPDRSVEFFYWTPDMPEIAVLSAHLVRDHYSTQLDQLSVDDVYLRTNYVAACYPSYNLSTFQTRKNAGSEVYASELWVKQYNPRYVDSWQWNIKQYTQHIDQKFFKMYDDQLRLGYKFCYSTVYDIGDFAPGINFNFET